jgi:hypothetical protein
MLVSTIAKGSGKGAGQLGGIGFYGFKLQQFAWCQIRWRHGMIQILGVLSGSLCKDMKRIIGRYRRFLVASVMLLLVGVVALSVATRRPCLHVRSGPWHTSKAGHMNESEQHESAVTKAAETADDVAAEVKSSPPRYVPHEEILPIALPLTLQRNHFRSPPVL